MKQTIRITIAAAVLSLVSACADTHEHTSTCHLGGKTVVPVKRH